MAKTGRLPFLPERIGGWWDRKSEIDVLAVSETQRSVLAGECKWSVNPVGTNILDDLKQKAAALNRVGQWVDVSYCLFARAGFTAALKEQAVRENALLVTVEEMLG